LERKGAKAGIITTAGFRDVLEMRRRDRPTTWGLWGQFTPVIERQNRLEVAERTLASGEVIRAVDADEIRAAAQTLLEQGCESVCLFFINGYANAETETNAAEILRAVWPNDHVSVATEILPEIREFERCSTASLNAYLQPVVANYLARLEERLASEGAPAEILIVQSNGGVMSVDTAKALPVRTALSGPAAGVVAARQIASAAGFENVITGDMGGTSFDVSLVADGQNTLTSQASIDFGMVIRTPMIEMTTIGAGGGSIAHIDETGLLDIGPQSAGSDPGPVCYGLGNDRPTVTDANLVLGRIDSRNPIGDKLTRLDSEAAAAAIDRHIATPLGITVQDAAEAVIRVANAKMAGAIRLISIERGHDPKRFAAMPFGGGGALHAGALVREIGLAAAIVPRFPGVNSALGCVMSDLRHDEVRTLNKMLDSLDCSALSDMIAEITAASQEVIHRSRANIEGLEAIIELDMLYLGQTHAVAVPISANGDTLSVEIIRAAFDASYRRAYGRLLENIPVRVLNLRLSVIGKRPLVDIAGLARGERANNVEDCHLAEQRIYAEGDWHDGLIIDRLRLPEGAIVSGPCLLVQPDATIYVDPGLVARVDRLGNIIIEEQR
ncbi:MAG: hydantoinase/oxoprolinase family protein, partial [Rhodobiaceae bacterium]